VLTSDFTRMFRACHCVRARESPDLSLFRNIKKFTAVDRRKDIFECIRKDDVILRRLTLLDAALHNLPTQSELSTLN